MRIVLMGSPDFAVPTLRELVAGKHGLVAVVTQPDRPAGRGRAWTPPPAKVAALEYGLPVLQPVDVSSPPSVERLKALEPDVFVVAAYGQILRQRVLDLPQRGSLNVHASFLPRHRGASPVSAAILAGDELTGVTIMEVVRALDAGPIVARVAEPISAHDTAGSLEARLATAGARLLCETLTPWAEGRLTPEPQDETLATYAPMLKRRDALIDWSKPAIRLWREVRAYDPWPVAHTVVAGAELRIREAWPLEGDSGRRPGTVLPPEDLPFDAGSNEPAFSVQTGEGRLAVIRLQRTGKRALGSLDFLRGQRGLVGSVLGE
jgi:methionyl-tRNA formyltransferase